jgi:hypothetical protein
VSAYDDLAALMARLPPPSAPKSLHAHPYAVEALKDMSAPADPAPWGGVAIGSLTGIPIFLDDEMATGAWEIREGDTVISSGVVRRPQQRVSQFRLRRRSSDHSLRAAVQGLRALRLRVSRPVRHQLRRRL